jgi:hypothetical protein
MGKAVGTGLRGLREGAGRAGHLSAEAAARAAVAAEHKLTEHGMSPRRLSESLADNAGIAREEIMKTTRRARKKMARNAKQTRKDLLRAADKARAEAKRAGKKVRARATDTGTALLSRVDKKVAKVRKKADRKISRLTGDSRRRRWPLLLGVSAVAAIAWYTMRARQAQAEKPSAAFPAEKENEPQATNGSSSAATSIPKPAREHDRVEQASRK